MQAHVWVESGTQMAPTPGLLCEWRRTPTGGYEGRVVMLAGTVHDPGQAISIRWIAAEKLRPVRADEARQPEAPSS